MITKTASDLRKQFLKETKTLPLIKKLSYIVFLENKIENNEKK